MDTSRIYTIFFFQRMTWFWLAKKIHLGSRMKYKKNGSRESEGVLSLCKDLPQQGWKREALGKHCLPLQLRWRGSLRRTSLSSKKSDWCLMNIYPQSIFFNTDYWLLLVRGIG